MNEWMFIEELLIKAQNWIILNQFKIINKTK